MDFVVQQFLLDFQRTDDGEHVLKTFYTKTININYKQMLYTRS